MTGEIEQLGMRLSEAIGLPRSDVDLDEGVLTVRRSKFGKSRLLPLRRTAQAVLLNYAARRDAHLGSRCSSHFFVVERGSLYLGHACVRDAYWCPSACQQRATAIPGCFSTYRLGCGLNWRPPAALLAVRPAVSGARLIMNLLHNGFSEHLLPAALSSAALLTVAKK
jgi:hypothetical protein